MSSIYLFLKGEATNLSVVFHQYWTKRKQRDLFQQPLLIDDGPDQTPLPPKKKAPLYHYFFLSCFDLCGTGLNSVGLIWVTASQNQMLRGSMVVFTAFFAYLFLGNRFHRLQYAGMLLVVLGLTLVGVSGFLSASDDDSSSPVQVVTGFFLVLAGSAVNSLQHVAEQRLLTGKEII